MKGLPRNEQGFSLIELMIVVAIIGLLSTIAIPQFNRYQNRAKASEALTNLGAIVTAQRSYFTEKGVYVHAANASPATIPGNARTTWVGNPDFDLLGWAPDGQVYFQYIVSADEAGSGRFTAEAASDIDNDGTPAFFAHVQASGGAGIDGRLAGTTCAGTGTYAHGAGTKSALRVTGPCDSLSGRKTF
jgi:prepilin-type N-terminal cleavage/methylation domain-containing protein